MRAPLEVLSLYPPHRGDLASLVESRCHHDPERPFLWYEGRSTSWGAFREEVSAAASMLLDRGVGPGDRVAVMAPNSDEYIVLFFALAQAGAILVPINPDFGVEEAGYVLQHAGVSAVFGSPAALSIAREACGAANLEAWNQGCLGRIGRWDDRAAELRFSGGAGERERAADGANAAV